MKHQTIKINIENPCHENWDKMVAEEKGKFCLSCQKTVVDFSRMSNEEIINYFNTANGNTCGRIAKHQLNLPISNYRNVKSPFFNKYIAGFLMALGFYNTGYSQETKEPTEQHTKGNMKAITNVPADKKLIVNGRIIDAKTKKGLAGAAITIVGSDITTATDKNGNYSVSVPARFQNESLAISVYHANYESFDITGIDFTKKAVSITTKLFKEEQHIKGEMIMGKIAPRHE